jgi:hypothetical protein
MTLRERLAFGWDVIRVIPRDPELIPMLAGRNPRGPHRRVLVDGHQV